MRALGSNVGAVWSGEARYGHRQCRYRQRRRAVSQRSSSSRAQISVYNTGAIARFLVGNSPFLCPYVIPAAIHAASNRGQHCCRRRRRHGLARAPAGLLQQLCGRPWAGRSTLDEQPEKADASRPPIAASRQLGPWVLIAVLCTHWQGPRTKLLLQAGLGTRPDAPRALSFPRKKSLTRTNLLKHPSTMPDFFAALRLLQHPQPRHPRD